MKKVVLAVALLCAAAAAHAQDTRFGIKISGGIAKFRGDGAPNQTNIASAGGGVMANVKLSEVFSVQPELLYMVKGSRDERGTTPVRYHNQYIELPVLLRASFGGVFLEAGPQFGYLLTPQTKTEGSLEMTDYSQAAFNEVEFGVAGGLGYQLASGLSLTGRYATGLNPVFTNVGTTKVKAYNSVLMLQLGFLFPEK